MVRKMLLALSVLGVLTTAVSTATAQNRITLRGSTNSMTFTGTRAGDWTLSLPSGGLTGSVNGTGTLLSEPGSYYTTQGSTAITGTFVSAGLLNITQKGALDSSYRSGYLEGNVQLLSLTPNGKTGTFNDTFAATLTLTGGSLESRLGTNAVPKISIDFATATSLSSLVSGVTLREQLAPRPLAMVVPNPEPGSMVLVGSGLLLLGGLVRRRRTAR